MQNAYDCMSRRKLSQHAHLVAFVTPILVSTAIGWFIPHFYTWTDSDQSRPSPLLWVVPVAGGLAACAFCCVLPWLPISLPESIDKPQFRNKFGLRSLLGLTTVVAIAIPLLAKFPIPTSGILCAVALLNFLRIASKYPQSRLPALTLLACMILPFAWIVGYEERGRILTDVLVMLPCLPTLLPAAVLGSAFGVGFQNSTWIALLLTGFELTLGIWRIRLGPRRALAYSLLAMLISTLSSLGFYQLCRA